MYIRAKSRSELARLIAPFMKQAGLPVDDVAKLEGVAGLVQERVKRLSEVPDMVRYLFEGPAVYAAADLVAKKSDATATAGMLEALKPLVATAAAAGADCRGGGVGLRGPGTRPRRGAGGQARRIVGAPARGGHRLEGLAAAL